MWPLLPPLLPNSLAAETWLLSSMLQNSGQLILHNVRIETSPTFLDYIQNETKLKFIVAVDFTASNGNPSDRNSLHYNDPTGAPNQYITAIQPVGNIIQDYDSDKLFLVLGFWSKKRKFPKCPTPICSTISLWSMFLSIFVLLP